jgi:hypothetical protein
MVLAARMLSVFRREDGVALLVALSAIVMLMALGAGLILTATSEAMIAGNFRLASEALYAAESGVELAVADLAGVADWSRVSSGLVRSTFVDGPPSGVRTLADGSTLDLARVVLLPGGPWQLYAYGNIRSMSAPGAIDSRFYVIVMAAGVVSTSAVLELRSEAYGPRGTHKIVEATVARTAGEPAVHIVSWRQSP